MKLRKVLALGISLAIFGFIADQSCDAQRVRLISSDVDDVCPQAFKHNIADPNPQKIMAGPLELPELKSFGATVGVASVSGSIGTSRVTSPTQAKPTKLSMDLFASPAKVVGVGKVITKAYAQQLRIETRYDVVAAGPVKFELSAVGEKSRNDVRLDANAVIIQEILGPNGDVIRTVPIYGHDFEWKQNPNGTYGLKRTPNIPPVNAVAGDRFKVTLTATGNIDNIDGIDRVFGLTYTTKTATGTFTVRVKSP